MPTLRDEDLDAFMAEKVMGWGLAIDNVDGNEVEVYASEGSFHCPRVLWVPTSKHGQAFMCLDEFNGSIDINRVENTDWTVVLRKRVGNGWKGPRVNNSSLPRAICEAIYETRTRDRLEESIRYGENMR